MQDLGRLTVVLTPELRKMAQDHACVVAEGNDLLELDDILREDVTEDNEVLDAAHSMGEALIITLLAGAMLARHLPADKEVT